MTATTPITVDRLRYGGDWSPEQWPRETWAEDIRLMTAAGVNLVTLGVFSWATLQPEAGNYDFDWLDEVVALCAEASIDVDLATPTASPPPWLGTAHPDVMAVTREGVRLSHGSRNHFCPSSPTYRAACRELARALAERYGSNPAVVMWHIGNEYGQVCYCERCETGFRVWLQERYATLDALNEAWGTAFWSQHYSGWDEIQLPRIGGYLINPAQTLDHRRFADNLLLQCYTDQVEVLRPLVGSSPITTNFMGFFALCDYRQWAPQVDIVADDHYVDPADKSSGMRAALTHDLMRSLRQGQSWLMMEQAMGAVNWRPHNVPKTAVQRRHDVLRAVAHGSDGVLSFQWRQSRAGSERFHSAMLPNAGPETSHHRAVREIGAELGRLADLAGSQVEAQVAILDDWPARWAMEEASVPSRVRSYLPVLESWYQPLWRRGLGVDVVSPRDDLSRYRVLLAPALHLIDQAGIDALRRYLARGGELVMGPFSAAVDEHTALHPGPFPGGLTDLLGARGEQWWPLGPEGVPVSSSTFGNGLATSWAEQLVADQAEVLASFEHTDLGPAVVRSTSCGFSYLAGDLPSPMLDAVLADALDRAGIAELTPLLDGPLQDGLEVAVRAGHVFVLNSSSEPAIVPLTESVIDLLTGRHLAQEVTIDAGGAVVLRKDHR